MSVDNQISLVNNFQNQFIQLSQQMGSALRDTVRVQQCTGKSDIFERIGAVVAQQKLTRHSSTDPLDTPFSRRRIYLTDWTTKDYIDNEDQIKMLANPQSDVVRVHVNAQGRKVDDLILEAAVGTATAMDASEATSSVALPSSQIIAHNFSTETNLSMEKIIQALVLLLDVDTNMDDGTYFAYNPKALGALLNDPTATSADYNSVRLLMSGAINSFCGFEWKKTTRIKTDSSGYYQCIAYVKPAIGLSVGQDINVKIDQLPTLDYSTQVFTSQSLGAGRLLDDGVVSVLCQQ